MFDERAAPDGEGFAEAGGGVEQAGLAGGVGGPGFFLEWERLPAALSEEGLEGIGGHGAGEMNRQDAGDANRKAPGKPLDGRFTGSDLMI